MDLKATRKDLADALTSAGLKVYSHVPEKITPPVVILAPGDPYVEPSESINELEFTANVDLILFVPSGTNAKSMDQLDDLISKVIVRTGGWAVQSVSVAINPIGDSQYLTAEVSLGTQFAVEN